MYFIPPTVNRPNLCLHGAYAVGENMEDEKNVAGRVGAPLLGGGGARSRYGRKAEINHYH